MIYVETKLGRLVQENFVQTSELTLFKRPVYQAIKKPKCWLRLCGFLFVIGYLFYQYFISGFVVITTGHFLRIDHPFFNTELCAHGYKSIVIGFALLV